MGVLGMGILGKSNKFFANKYFEYFNRPAFWVMVAAFAFHHSPTVFGNIFGDDDRELVKNTELFPFSAVGKLENGCTAELVGPQLILTTAHCIVNETTGALRTDVGQYQVGIRFGNADDKARIEKAWVGTFNPSHFRGKDWAIAKLSKVIKPSIRRLKLKAVDLSRVNFPYAINLAGFSKDLDDVEGMSVHRGCALRAFQNGTTPLNDIKVAGTVLNDCDSYAGISGGMLYEKNQGDEEEKIIAIAASENRGGASISVRRDGYSHEYANFAVPVGGAVPVLEGIAAALERGQEPGKIDGAFQVTFRGDTNKSSSCVSFQDATGGVAFNPVDTAQKMISDREKMESFARSRSFDGVTLNIQSLVRERGGSLAYGLTNNECQRAISDQNQKNGLVCSAGLSYNIFRTTNGSSLTSSVSGSGANFNSIEDCFQAVRSSTPQYVCAKINAVHVAAIRLATGEAAQRFSYLSESNASQSCFDWIRTQSNQERTTR